MVFDGRSLAAGEYVGIDVAIDDSTIILFNNMIVGTQIADQGTGLGSPIYHQLFCPEIVNYRWLAYALIVITGDTLLLLVFLYDSRPLNLFRIIFATIPIWVFFTNII